MTRTVRLDRPGRRERRAARRRLRRIDALSAQLAQLQTIQTLLEQATEVVLGGWVQGAWFAVDVGGKTRMVIAQEVRLTADHPVTGACLVGAVVQAGGGPPAVRSQPVQRALDLIWHSLREDGTQPVRWCPGPPMRTMHVLDLTYWNDAPRRTRDDVVGLLRSSRASAEAQKQRCRSELLALAASSTSGPGHPSPDVSAGQRVSTTESTDLAPTCTSSPSSRARWGAPRPS
jgi:hypothetical protein